ncbi:MAG: hypothetical protein Q9164_001475 [Protoblastenia rupestris]
MSHLQIKQSQSLTSTKATSPQITAGMPEITRWLRKVEQPHIDDTDGEDSEDEKIKNMAVSSSGSDNSQEMIKVANKLGDAGRAIKEMRRQRKIEEKGLEAEVHDGDWEIVELLEARSAAEHREVENAARILHQMSKASVASNALDLTTPEDEGRTDTGSIAKGNSESEKEDTASGDTAIIETRVRQESYQPTLRTYQRIQRQRFVAARQLLPDVTAPDTVNPKGPKRAKRLRPAVDKLEKSPAKKPKNNKRPLLDGAAPKTTTAKEPKRPETAAKSEGKPAKTGQGLLSKKTHQQQALDLEPAPVVITSEQEYAEITEGAKSGMATAGRVMRKRNTVK